MHTIDGKAIVGVYDILAKGVESIVASRIVRQVANGSNRTCNPRVASVQNATPAIGGGNHYSTFPVLSTTCSAGIGPATTIVVPSFALCIGADTDTLSREG